MDPDQLASREASCSGSTMFSIEYTYLVSYCFIYGISKVRAKLIS